VKKLLLYLLFLGCVLSIKAQKKEESKPASYTTNLAILKNAKDSLYKSILVSYNAYLFNHPNDIEVCIEKCRFVENAFYDSEEDYNPNYESCKTYLDSLLEKYPNEPGLIIYRSEYAYGDSSISYCLRAINKYENYPDKWKDKQISLIYEKLANAYNTNEKPKQSLEYALLAKEKNDSLDLSLLIARNYNTLKQKDKAILALLQQLDSTSLGWELNQKGELLLELGSISKALVVLRWAQKDSTVRWSNNTALANALIENGLYKQARVYLVEESKKSWEQTESFQKLFDYDLKYSSADTARASYKRLVTKAYLNDPLGVKRIRLFLNAPSLGWSFTDVLRVLSLILAVVLIFCIPYLWILPIQFIGNYYKSKGSVFSQNESRWSLRHFWIICALVLIVDVVAGLIFEHDVFLSISDGEKGVTQDSINLNLAHSTLFTISGYLLMTLLVLKWRDLKEIWGTYENKSKLIFKGIGTILLLRFVLGLYLKLIGFMSDDIETESSVVENIRAINQFYSPLLGFLLVVIIVPFYEEFIFRGIILSACEKYMKFIFANSLQAALFAAVHLDLKLFPFFFLLAYIAGYQRHKTSALAPGISMHITNNLIAFFVILV
jgi:uncharacterized protein